MTRRLDDAVMLLDIVSSFDARYRGLDHDALVSTTQAWAMQLDATNLTLDELTEGARRAYSTPERPTNPVGAILTEARTARGINRQGHAVAAISAQTTTYPAYGEKVLEAAYAKDDAINLTCPTCGARAGQWCTARAGAYKHIPHGQRLRRAYVTNNPDGQARRQVRQAHLRQWREAHGPS